MKMANKKSRLRIQLAPSAKISLRPHASKPAKVNHRQEQVESKTSMPTKEFSVGMILRSCLASVDAMLPEVEDHRADIETEMPDFNVKFKGCLAAVGATIDAEPGTDFTVTNDISEDVTDPEKQSQTTVEEESDDAPVVVKRKPGRPRKVIHPTRQSVDSRTPALVEPPVAQQTNGEKKPEQLPSNRTLRDRSTKSESVGDPPPRVETPKPEVQPTGASNESKKRGRPKKSLVNPESSSSEEANTRDNPISVSSDTTGTEDKLERAGSPDAPEMKRGRGRKKLIEVEEPPPAKTEEVPVGPRRGRKRTRTGSEATPDCTSVDEAQRTGSPEPTKCDESPKKEAEADEGTKEPVELSKKKRGRFRGERSSKEDAEIEKTGTTETADLGVAAKQSPVNAVPSVAAVIRKSLRSAEDSDSADTVIEETNQVRRRGRPPSTDESRSSKQHQRVAPPRGRGKKTVLKVALPIRARSTRGQAEKSAESLPAGGSIQSPQSTKFSLPPPPPPASATSRSPSPKVSSPRGSARTVRVTAKKKPQRNSHASDTDTAEETLDQEEFLRQKEKLESIPVAASTPSTSHPVCTIPVHTESARSPLSSPLTTTARLDEPAGKKPKTITGVTTAASSDGTDAAGTTPSDASVTVVEGKRERKRKVVSEFADPNAILELAPTTTKSQSTVASQQSTSRQNVVLTPEAATKSAQSTASTVTVKPMVTIVGPTMTNKPNITLVSPSQPSCSYLQSGLKPIVITVPPPSSRQGSGSTFSGVTKTIVLPKVITRPIGQNVQQQQSAAQTTQLHNQPHIRSIRLSPSMTPASAQRSTATIISRPPPQRVLPSGVRATAVQTPTSGSVVIRTIGSGSLSAPRLITSGSIRPSIIRTPRIVTSMPGGVRPRLISTFTGASGARIVTVRPSVSGATMQTIRTTLPGQPNKVYLRTVAPMVPQRHITVQATPSQPMVRTVTQPAGSRPVSAAMVIRSPPKIVVKPSEATATKQTVTTKRVPQQPVKPVERKVAPQPAKKPAVQHRKVVSVARSAPEAVQPSSSGLEKLLEEPQLPKVGKKPLSKKQRSMRKTDLIKTSTRSRRRGTDLQINYNEDRLSKITDEDSDSQEDVPTSTEELGSPEDIQQPEDNDEEEPQDDIPVAVVEVFLSQDEVKLREVHSPTKQDLVDLHRQPVEQPLEVALGGQGAPEGFFTSEEGLVETVDVPFEGAAIEAMKAGLVSNNDNAFAKTLMLGDDALLRKKVSKRKSNPLAKD